MDKRKLDEQYCGVGRSRKQIEEKEKQKILKSKKRLSHGIVEAKMMISDTNKAGGAGVNPKLLTRTIH